ncbi:MAG: Xaa-Pro peptidase family protein, partial [Dehalococcoidia bacterium]
VDNQEASSMVETQYQARTRRLQEKLRENGLDGIVLSSTGDIYYFGGFWGYMGAFRKVYMIVPSEGPPSMLTSRLEEAYTRASTWISDIYLYTEFPEEGVSQSDTEVVARLVEEGIGPDKRIGFDEDDLTAGRLAALQVQMPKAILRPAKALVYQLRIIKDVGEIEVMRKVGQVAMAQAEGIRQAVAPGVTEYELTLVGRAAGSRKAAELLGPEERRFSPLIPGVQVVVSGAERTDWVHGRATTRVLGPSDVVDTCYCETATYRGYWLGFDRPFAAGKPPQRVLDVMKIGLEMQEAALAAVRPGVRACDVDKAAADVLEKHGMLQYRRHRTGRGVGVDAAEKPDLRASDQTVLQPGMTFSVEPGIYIPGELRVRFGDSVAVTEDGYLNFTPFPKEIPGA